LTLLSGLRGTKEGFTGFIRMPRTVFERTQQLHFTGRVLNDKLFLSYLPMHLALTPVLLLISLDDVAKHQAKFFARFDMRHKVNEELDRAEHAAELFTKPKVDAQIREGAPFICHCLGGVVGEDGVGRCGGKELHGFSQNLVLARGRHLFVMI
jgi:hypothetical protein